MELTTNVRNENIERILLDHADEITDKSQIGSQWIMLGYTQLLITIKFYFQFE